MVVTILVGVGLFWLELWQLWSEARPSRIVLRTSEGMAYIPAQADAPEAAGTRGHRHHREADAARELTRFGRVRHPWQNGCLCPDQVLPQGNQLYGVTPEACGTSHPSPTLPAVDLWRPQRETIMQILDAVDAASLRSDIPDFNAGDTVKVHVNITEGNRSRIQVFQGVVIGRSGDGVRETFTVRKISFQVGVERTFPVHSPVIDHIEVVTRGDVRRAKLYYLRNLRGKKAKIKEKRG